MNMKTRWHIHFAVVLIPFSIPLAAGVYWLWMNQMLILWAGASAALGVCWWLIIRLFRSHRSNLELLDVSTAIGSSPQNQQAYKTIEAISVVRRSSNPDLSSSQFYIQTLLEVMQSVAKQYHPKSKDALLEIKLPYLLKVIEMLAQDLRVNLAENIPGSHVFSLNDFARSQRFASRSRELYRIFRIVTAGLDPVSAMIRELKMVTNQSILSQSADELKRWLIDAYIKKIGYYAIELYSGNMVLDDQLLSKPTCLSQQQLSEINRREKSVAAEPFRILVLGQTNAGKSSLINALFGTVKAETGVIPVKGISSYILERPDLETAVIMDCEGYGRSDCAQLIAQGAKEIVRSDMILLTVSATNAARQVDKQMLEAIKKQFAAHGKSNFPAIIVALTHIDQLRPVREWNPPYDVIHPDSQKAQSIRMAMEMLAKELELEIDQIAPVNLKSGFEYNIEEGLIPAIFQQLEQAEQVRYLRCLKEYRKEDHWRLLWKQSKSTGQFIAIKGLGAFDSIPKLKSVLSLS